MSEIKVGSEWVFKDNCTVTCKILFVGNTKLFAERDNGIEFMREIKSFLKYYNPAPVRRTVWLNVYEGYVLSYNSKQSADLKMSNAVLFQQEVELIDPREGEKG